MKPSRDTHRRPKPELPDHTSGIYFKQRRFHIATPTDWRIKQDIELLNYQEFTPNPGDAVQIKLLPTEARAKYLRGEIT
ncbi:MAG: hypothetical protein AAFY76_20305, partial [Cyanobacteria bacterium J06649_11]